MPTKRNRAGQQQNYVPPGNGDASGEYGDNATGSNKHFTAFKKPEEKSFSTFNKEQPKTEEPKENKYLGGSKAKSDFYVAMLTSGISNSKTKIENEEEFIKQLKDTISNANEESISVLQYLFDTHPIEFTENKYNSAGSYYCPGMRQVYIDKTRFDRGFEQQGSPLFHELGHCINDTFKIREDVKWYKENHALTDAYSLFDDKLSVADTLQEELKEFAANKHAPKIRKEKSKYVNALLKEHGFTLESYEKMAQQSRSIIDESQEWQEIKARIVNDFNNGKFASVKDANIELRKQLEVWKANGSYKDFFATLHEQRPHYLAACNEWYKKTGIQAVSDAWSSKSDFGFGLGHDRQYYSKDRYSSVEPKSKVADEFFANFYAAFSTNETAALETTKKYFPRTYDKMVKLVEYVKAKKDKQKYMQEEIAKFQRGESL